MITAWTRIKNIGDRGENGGCAISGIPMFFATGPAGILYYSRLGNPET